MAVCVHDKCLLLQPGPNTGSAGDTSQVSGLCHRVQALMRVDTSEGYNVCKKHEMWSHTSSPPLGPPT